MRRTYGVIRIAFAGGIAAAIIAQLSFSLSFNPLSIPHLLWNFFSFFTILSNCVSVIALLVGAWYCFRVKADPEWFNIVRASVAAYMVTTGFAYGLLLRDVSLDQANTLVWSNEILHVWAPLYLLLDWLFASGRSPLSWRRLWIVAVFPIAWAVYTMVRGTFVDWYPYPFLDPSQPGGYRAVLFYVILISIVILATGFGLFAISRARKLQPPA